MLTIKIDPGHKWVDPQQKLEKAELPVKMKKAHQNLCLFCTSAMSLSISFLAWWLAPEAKYTTLLNKLGIYCFPISEQEWDQRCLLTRKMEAFGGCIKSLKLAFFSKKTFWESWNNRTLSRSDVTSQAVFEKLLTELYEQKSRTCCLLLFKSFFCAERHSAIWTMYNRTERWVLCACSLQFNLPGSYIVSQCL